MPEVKVPWEQDGEEFDAAKAKRYLTALLEDKEKLQERNAKLAEKAKAGGSEASDLKSENLRLKVQLNTGLDDRQVARLVGDSYDDMMKDAEAYAEETGIELRSFFEPEGTAEDSQQGEKVEESKGVERNFRAPQQKIYPEDTFDAKAIIGAMDL